MKSLTIAEKTLQELGVTAPGEIDLEAIAWHLGARIKYCVLDKCEAQIIGHGNRAIIRVDNRKSFERQRFSIGHELGHWQHHRGRMLICRAEDIGNRKAPPTERVADSYASDLILPRYLLDPVVRQHSKLSFRVVREIAQLFGASITATAIKIVESRHSPAILICHGREGRSWFSRSPDVPERWFPQEMLDVESAAFDVLFGDKADQNYPSVIGADAWFDKPEAARYEIREQTIRITADNTLTLLLITDGRMLEDR